MSAESFASETRRLCARSAEPLADPAWAPTARLAAEAARSLRVVLSGEGADELFGGYPTYAGIAVAGLLGRLSPGWRRRLARAAARLPPSDRKVTLSFLLRRLGEGLELEGIARHREWTAAIPAALLARLRPGRQPPAPDAGEGCLLDAAQAFDLETTLAEGLLTKADRAAMGFGLEVRAPYLDRQVLELAARLPPADRVRGLRTKVLLKRYARTLLPRRVVAARKRGLSVPLASWLRGPLAEPARAALDSSRLELLGVDRAVATALFAEHCARRADHSRPLWTLIVAALWLDTLPFRPERSVA